MNGRVRLQPVSGLDLGTSRPVKYCKLIRIELFQEYERHVLLTYALRYLTLLIQRTEYKSVNIEQILYEYYGKFIRRRKLEFVNRKRCRRYTKIFMIKFVSGFSIT